MQTAALKACKDEAKELKALANKAGSKASKKWTLAKRVEVQNYQLETLVERDVLP